MANKIEEKGISRREMLKFLACLSIPVVAITTNDCLNQNYKITPKLLKHMIDTKYPIKKEILDEIKRRKETELTLYNISTLDDLKIFSKMYYPGIYYLQNDIDCNGEYLNPIGNNNDQFNGIFIGNGYTISNFRISTNNSFFGFFGYIRSDLKHSGNCIIEGLNLENYLIEGDSFGGGLVGKNYYGYILNCNTSGTINGNLTCGGLVGVNEGTILDCSSNGDVNGKEYIGKLIGTNVGKCFGCTSNAKVNGLEGKLIGCG
jgi:hypothetical protein